MAEVVALRNNILPYPIYGFSYGVVFPILDNTGSLVTGAAGLDSEVSLNGNTFADCTNEATEIGSSGMYYLLLTGAETSADIITVVVKTSTTDAKTTPLVLYTKKWASPDIYTGTAAGGAAGYITLDGGASDTDDAYTGMMVVAVVDGTTYLRVIVAYDGSTKQASVHADFPVTPDSDDTFYISLPPEVLFRQPVDAVSMDGVEGAGNVAADALLGRNVSGGSSSGRLVKQALHFLRNKFTVSGGTLTVYETDDSTPSWTSAVSSDAGAEPIIGSDPS
jgi:hypothetical protein